MAIGKGIRKDFPILSRKINGHRLAYLDSAATSQKPKAVLEAMSNYYSLHNGNPRRGVHTLASEADEIYEKARAIVAYFIGAKPNEIIFTKNATESLNLLSYSLETLLPPDLERPIAVTKMEHHSNFVPWQQLCKIAARKLEFIPFKPSAPMSESNLHELHVTSRPAIISLAHASNVLGTINDVHSIANYAHEKFHCPLIIDAAQSVPHLKINVKGLGVDFAAFSSHKMLGPAGIGVLYASEVWHSHLKPFMTGGGQIGKVYDHSSTWADAPAKFEAGTQDVAGAVGLAAAITYLKKIGMDAVHSHEQKLAKKAIDALAAIDGVAIYGPLDSSLRTGLVSFNLKGVHPHDLAEILNRNGVAIRAGHHCAQPLMRELSIQSCARASFYVYNDSDDVNALIDGVKEAKKIFGA